MEVDASASFEITQVKALQGTTTPPPFAAAAGCRCCVCTCVGVRNQPTTPNSTKTKTKGHSDRVWHLAWSPSGNLLASCSGDKTIRDPPTTSRQQ
jgi:hypothetical protein